MSERDRDILQVLLHRVRILSLTQLAETWWPGTKTAERSARRWARRMETGRLVRIHDIVAHPLIPITEPSLVWTPGDPRPEFGKVAYRLQARWHLDPIGQSVVTATPQAATRFGGHPGRQVRLRDGTHELHHSQAYLSMRKADPHRASTWVSEAELAARGAGHHEPLPDALVFDGEPPSPTVIEFAGAYTKAKLEHHHRYYERHQVGYELW